MPFSDRKKSPKVHSGKETEYEVCKKCGELIPWGTRCPYCKATYEEFEKRWYGLATQKPKN